MMDREIASMNLVSLQECRNFLQGVEGAEGKE